jgi:hypothetical protein
MRNRRLSTIAGLLIIVALAGYIYVIAGSRDLEEKMGQYLRAKGYQAEEIKSIEVYHSFLNPFLSCDRWTIKVRYLDEPGAIYLYTVKDGKIESAGATGSVNREDLKHGE